MRKKMFFLALSAFGIMLLNNTATAYAEWDSGSSYRNGYSGQIVLGALDRHDLNDFRRADSHGGGDALFGSTSIQSPVTLIAGADIEIEIMTAGELVHNRYVNGKACSGTKRFNAFVTPMATCSSHFGSNFSGFRAQAEEDTADAVGGGKKWKPMLYMNVRGRWVDLGAVHSSADSGLVVSGVMADPSQCAQVLVQKICQ